MGTWHTDARASFRPVFVQSFGVEAKEAGV